MTLDKIQRVIEIVAGQCDPKKAWLSAEHDIIYLPLMNDAAISPEADAELKSLGAFKSDVECWALYT